MHLFIGDMLFSFVLNIRKGKYKVLISLTIIKKKTYKSSYLILVKYQEKSTLDHQIDVSIFIYFHI